MAKNALIFCSENSFKGKIKLLSTHEKKPWVVYYNEDYHSITVMDFSSKVQLMHRTLQSILEAAPCPMSHSQNPSSFAGNEIAEIVFPEFISGTVDAAIEGASFSHGHGQAHEDTEQSNLLAELGEVRSLGFTDCFQQPTLSTLHADGYIQLQTTLCLIFYNFLSHKTLFLSNHGSLVIRGSRALGVAAGGRHARRGSDSSSGISSSSISSNSGGGNGRASEIGFHPTCSAFIDVGVMAVGCADGSLRLWSLCDHHQSCHELTRWQAYKVGTEVSALQHLAQPGFESDALRLVTVGGDGEGYIWSATRAGQSGDLLWQVLDSNAGGALDPGAIAPIARFSLPLPPLSSSCPTYSPCSCTLSLVLADRSIYSLSMTTVLQPTADSAVDGRHRSSTSGSDRMSGSGVLRGRSSFGEESRYRSTTASSLTSTQQDASKSTGSGRKSILGSFGVSSISKGFLSFMGGNAVGPSGPSFLEDAAWEPIEIHAGVHCRHKIRHCVAVTIGVRGEVMFATKGSGVVAVCCPVGTGSSPELAVQEEWNVGSAISALVGGDDDGEAETGTGANHGPGASTEKGAKVYVLAMGCHAHLVAGTNKGLVVARCFSARVPDMTAATHAAWEYVLSSTASGSSVRVAKVVNALAENARSTGAMSVMASTVVDETTIVTPECSALYTARLLPSVSGKYCCLLVAPRSSSDISSTYVILSTAPRATLKEIERGLCTAFAWVGAKDMFVCTTATAQTPAQGNKRASLLNSVKGLIGREKEAKGSAVVVRGCLVKTVEGPAGPASFTAEVATAAEASGSSAPIGGLATSPVSSDGIVALSGPLVFLSSNAQPSASSLVASNGAFYHCGIDGNTGSYQLTVASQPLALPLDVRWTPCRGSRRIPPDGTIDETPIGALCAFLLPTDSIMILGVGLSKESASPSSSGPARRMVVTCLFTIGLQAPAYQLDRFLCWAPSTGPGPTVDLLHTFCGSVSLVIPIPKDHGRVGASAAELIDMFALPIPRLSGKEPVPAVHIAKGHIVYLTQPPVAVKIAQAAPAIAMIGCLQSGRSGEAQNWAGHLSKGRGAGMDEFVADMMSQHIPRV